VAASARVGVNDLPHDAHRSFSSEAANDVAAPLCRTRRVPSVRRSGNLLPPSPPAEQATARHDETGPTREAAIAAFAKTGRRE